MVVYGHWGNAVVGADGWRVVRSQSDHRHRYDLARECWRVEVAGRQDLESRRHPIIGTAVNTRCTRRRVIASERPW
jgi:hypothetical protein